MEEKTSMMRSETSDRKGGATCFNGDCFARDTQIQMSDGRTKRADEIQIGDMLLCEGEYCKVDDIIKGMETELVHIKTDNGSEIKVTKQHAMLLETKKGKAAGTLCQSDRILMADGTSTAVKSVEPFAYNDIVYNFISYGNDEGIYLEANGLLAGDFSAENSIALPK